MIKKSVITQIQSVLSTLVAFIMVPLPLRVLLHRHYTRKYPIMIDEGKTL